jgi:hypothetical protein
MKGIQVTKKVRRYGKCTKLRKRYEVRKRYKLRKRYEVTKKYEATKRFEVTKKIRSYEKGQFPMVIGRILFNMGAKLP